MLWDPSRAAQGVRLRHGASRGSHSQSCSRDSATLNFHGHNILGPNIIIRSNFLFYRQGHCSPVRRGVGTQAMELVCDTPTSILAAHPGHFLFRLARAETHWSLAWSVRRHVPPKDHYSLRSREMLGNLRAYKAGLTFTVQIKTPRSRANAPHHVLNHTVSWWYFHFLGLLC